MTKAKMCKAILMVLVTAIPAAVKWAWGKWSKPKPPEEADVVD